MDRTVIDYMDILPHIPPEVLEEYSSSSSKQIAGGRARLIGEGLLNVYPRKPVGVVRHPYLALMLAVVRPKWLWLAMGDWWIEEALHILHGRRCVAVIDYQEEERFADVPTLFQDYIARHRLRWARQEVDVVWLAEQHLTLIEEPQPTEQQIRAARRFYHLREDGYGEFHALADKIGFTAAYKQLGPARLYPVNIPTPPPATPAPTAAPKKAHIMPVEQPKPYNDGMVMFPTLDAEEAYFRGDFY